VVTEARLEEAVSVGIVQNLHGTYEKGGAPRVKEVVKYSSADSAPAHHGLFVEFESGERFEITIQRRP
jgi:hypothetical protein